MPNPLLLCSDGVVSLGLLARNTWKRQVKSWILVPLGIVLLLYFVLALDTAIGLGAVAFPASVACLLILFFLLLVAKWTLPERVMGTILAVLEVPTGFALRTMNLYFTPSFILLPLSKPISGAEIGALIGVFIIGYVVQYALVGYTSRILQIMIARFAKRSNPEEKVRHAESTGENSEVVADGGEQTGDSKENANTAAPSDETLSDGNEEKKDTADPSSRETSDGEDRGRTTTSDSPAVLEAEGNYRSQQFPRSQRWAEILAGYTDVMIYLCLFIFVGIPAYYGAGYTMPIFLTFTVLMFHAANAIPKKVKRIAHPVLVTSLVTILVVWVISLTLDHSLDWGLNRYRVGTSYLRYLSGTKNLPLPGAGDILAGLLDASIVALAMPMYQYRRELYQFLWAILIPVVALTIPSLLGYPPLCSALGISQTISLAMAPRSVTLALAQLSSDNLGGNSDAISPIAVVSGISGPIFGPSILRLLRISKDDFVTTGVVLGANSSAIATAMLLEKDRRAAALSSLSMSVFGILFVVLTVIPPVTDYVRSLVGL